MNPRTLDHTGRQNADVLRGRVRRMVSCARGGQISFFPLRAEWLKSPSIKTQKRGFAVCVNLPFSRWPLPPLPLRAAFRTPTRPQTTPLCAPSVAPVQVPSSQARRVVARPKVRLLAHLPAASLAVLRACPPATDTRLLADLIAAPFRVISSSKTIQGFPLGGFFAFCAARVTEKGLPCSRKS